MGRLSKGYGVSIRGSDSRDVGATKRCCMDEVLPSDKVIELLQAEWPLKALEAAAPGETAQRWGYADGSGEGGVISRVTKAFCRCGNRIRPST